MADPMKFFYMVVPPEPAFRELATLKALCDPTGRGDPHITVKGPLDHPIPRYQLEAASGAVRGKACRVHGVGTFWNAEKTQHTVFLEVSCPALLPLWENPQRAPEDCHLHMTMYDGPDREYAKQVKRALTKAKVNVTFSLSGLILWEKPEPTLSQRMGLPKLSMEDRMKGIAKPSTLVVARLRTLADSMQALHQEMAGGGDSEGNNPAISQEGSAADDADAILDALDGMGYRRGDGKVPGTYKQTTFGGERIEWVVSASLSKRVTLGVSRSTTSATYTLNERTFDTLPELLEELPAVLPEPSSTSQSEDPAADDTIPS